MAHWKYCQFCEQWSKSATPLSEDKSCPFCGKPFIAQISINPISDKKAVEQPNKAAAVQQLNVAAAASLVDVMHELQGIYSTIEPNVNINFTFDSSGDLAEQIEAGEPFDLFISAAKFPMDVLQDKGLIDVNSRKDLLSNTLVLIAPEDSTLTSIQGLTDPSVKTIAIGDPDTVPAGYYARQTLDSMGLWEELLPKYLYEDNVRVVLSAVQLGVADAGFVYRSDTYQAEGIKIVEIAPEDSHEPIVYPMAIVSASNSKAAAQDFANFLTTPQASQVFRKYYFIPLSQPATPRRPEVSPRQEKITPPKAPPKIQNKAAAVQQLNVAAAASLVDVMHELQGIYSTIEPNVNINFTFASSGDLAEQIEAGEPFDLFISAAKFPMDVLQEKGLIDVNSRKDLLSNTLVLIAPQDSTLTSIQGLTDPSVKTIAIGDPDTVPAGYYARQTLDSMGLWEELLPKYLYEDNVRMVLSAVQLGVADAGFVYRSDTYQAGGIKIVEIAPEDSHEPIIYPMAIVSASNSKAAAQDFANFLTTPQASQVFRKYYFIPLSQPATFGKNEKYKEVPPVAPPTVFDEGAGDGDISARLDKIEAVLTQCHAAVHAIVEKGALREQGKLTTPEKSKKRETLDKFGLKRNGMRNRG